MRGANAYNAALGSTVCQEDFVRAMHEPRPVRT
jgi:hypothetical protein